MPQYSAFDAAHNIQHVRKVIQTSLNLAKRHGVDYEMVYVVAAFHDLGMKYGRADHAYHSGRILRNDRFIGKMFKEYQISVMVEAVVEHGSGFRKEPHTIYGKIIAQADRSLDVDMMVERAIGYGLANYPEYTKEEQCSRAIEYLQKKYGENGRVKLWLEDEADIKSLNRVRHTVMDSAQMKKICEKYLEVYQR